MYIGAEHLRRAVTGEPRCRDFPRTKFFPSADTIKHRENKSASPVNFLGLSRPFYATVLKRDSKLFPPPSFFPSLSLSLSRSSTYSSRRNTHDRGGTRSLERRFRNFSARSTRGIRRRRAKVSLRPSWTIVVFACRAGSRDEYRWRTVGRPRTEEKRNGRENVKHETSTLEIIVQRESG